MGSSPCHHLTTCRIFGHIGFAGLAEPDGQTYATRCKDQLNRADLNHKVYCMCFVADRVRYDACSAVPSAVLTWEKWHAS